MLLTLLSNQATGAVTLLPPLTVNTNAFYAATVAQGSSAQDLSPSLYTNTQNFYTATSASIYALNPALFTNTNTFYASSVSTSTNLTPPLFANTQTFYAPTITASRTLTPALFTNTNAFYSPSATNLNLIAPLLFADGDFVFPPTVTSAGPTQALTPALLTNTNTFPPATVSTQQSASLVRPRRRFRPAILIDLPKDEIALPDVSAKTILAGLSVSVTVGSVIARSPDPINSRAIMGFTQIEAYMPNLAARSSWNDPSDEELLFILDCALD